MRAKDLPPGRIGFVPRPSVRWLSPTQLAGTAIRVLGAKFFGAYLDKRELQGAFADEVYDHSREVDESGAFWLDFAADTGDGFDATYSIASLLARPELEVDGHAGALPRGRVLVFGGDEVYPTPSWSGYEHRLRGPYTAALPDDSGAPGETETPSLYALPGNHDWYDGLTAFLRVFAKEGRIGGWRTRQSRSYFALKLPHRWWLYAVDTQLEAYIDDPQLAYFRAAAEQLEPGDRLVVCVPSPTWVRTGDTPEAYDPIDYFLRQVVRPTGASCAVLLSGDLHHYARYELREPDAPAEPDAPDEPDEVPAQSPEPEPAKDPEPPRQLITCGGAGAFLYGTHRLPDALEVPSPDSMTRRRSPSRAYDRKAVFPTAAVSRRAALGVFARLPLRNPGFVGLVGVVHTLLLYALLASRESLFTPASIAMPVLVLAGTIALAGAQPGSVSRARYVHRIAGALHGLAHLGLGVAGVVLWNALPFEDLGPPWRGLVTVVVYGSIMGVLGSELVAAYFLAASLVSVNLDELYASQSIEDHKSFLRMRFGSDGRLTVFPVALDRAGRRWRLRTATDPAGSAGQALVVPDRDRDTLRPHLAEPPIEIARD